MVFKGFWPCAQDWTLAVLGGHSRAGVSCINCKQALLPLCYMTGEVSKEKPWFLCYNSLRVICKEWQPEVQRDRVLFLWNKDIVMLIFMGSAILHREEEIIGHFPSLEATLIQNSCPSEKVSTPAWCMLFTYDFILIVLHSRDWPLLLTSLIKWSFPHLKNLKPFVPWIAFISQRLRQNVWNRWGHVESGCVGETHCCGWLRRIW